MTQLLTSDSYIPTTSGAITLPSITNNGDGSVTVGTGVFYLHDAYHGESHVNKYTVSGATFTLVDGSNNYIYADYNAGSPVLKQTTDRASFVYTPTATPIYTIYRNGTALTILDWDTSGTALPEKLLIRAINNKRFERDETIGGLILADSGSLHFTISAGTIWYGVNNQALTSLNSAVDTVKRYLWNGTAWTSSAVTTFENTYYQGPSGLVAVSTARYCITWVYRSVQSGKVAYTLLGTADYKLAEAQAAPAPSNVPPEISSTCVLVGRIIVAKSATTATEVDSAFITPFASAGGTGTTNHNDLSGRDATGCHPASSITNTPAGNIAATTVQAALNELDTEKAALSGATFTGGVSAPSFDSATLNLGTSTATQINLGTASTTQTVNIGTGSGTTTINLGGAGDTVNISGTLAYVNVTNMTVTDKLITLNKGGGASTGFSSGFEIEENSSITGYCRSTSDNVSWEIKAPGSAGIATISTGASNVSIWHTGNFDPASKADAATAITTSNIGSQSVTYASESGFLRTEGGYLRKLADSADTYGAGITVSFVKGSDGWDNYGSLTTIRGYSSGGGGTLQLYTPYGAEDGGTSLKYRICDYNDGSPVWKAFKTIIDSENIGSQSVNYAKAMSVLDTRADVSTPESIDTGLICSFKSNSTEGLFDGGNYFGEITFRPWGLTTDWSGGKAHQLGFTDGGHIFHRCGTSTTWGSWNTLIDTTNIGSQSVNYAASAGTSTNLSGGSVSATTGSFSGVLTAPTAAAGTNTTQVATTAFVKAAIAAAGGSVANNATTITGTECTTWKAIHSGTATVYGVIVTNTTSFARYFKLASNSVPLTANNLFLKVEVPAGQTVSLFPTGGIPDTAGGYSNIYAFCTTGSSDTDTTYASSGDMFATILWA